jgi:hypothetical protein
MLGLCRLATFMHLAAKDRFGSNLRLRIATRQSESSQAKRALTATVGMGFLLGAGPAVHDCVYPG